MHYFNAFLFTKLKINYYIGLFYCLKKTTLMTQFFKITYLYKFRYNKGKR